MGRILVVEDDPVLRAIFSEVLTAAGHEVRVAVDGAEGAALAVQGDFDLVLTDILMPEVDGIELIRRLKDEGVPAKILAVSSGGSYASGDVLTWAKASGADEVMTKPVDYGRLLAVVEALLAGPDSADEGGGDGG